MVLKEERNKQTKEKEIECVMSRMFTYVPGVLEDLGFGVIPLLIHLINLCMHVLTEFL